jgi:hypothetical protein
MTLCNGAGVCGLAAAQKRKPTVNPFFHGQTFPRKTFYGKVAAPSDRHWQNLSCVASYGHTSFLGFAQDTCNLVPQSHSSDLR